MIKFHEPFQSKNQKKYVLDVLDNNLFIKDKYSNLCKEFLIEMYGVNEILLTHSATAALEISSKLLKLEYENSRRILIPSYTFSSTANAFLIDNHEIKFIDIDEKDLIVNKKKLLNKSDILVVVHYANSCFDFDKEINSNIIEDAAQSFDAKLNNKYLGTFGKYGCISFHRTKNVHSDYGGMVILNDNSYFDEAKYIYERGTDRSEVIAGNKNKYQWVQKGSSYQISELSSALLLSQLEDKDIIREIKKNIYFEYEERLSDLVDAGLINIQKINPDLDPNYHAFYIITKDNNRKMIDYLKSKGISAYIGYEPLHLSEYALNNNLQTDLYITESIYKKIIRLPLHTNIKKTDVKYIVDTIKKYYE